MTTDEKLDKLTAYVKTLAAEHNKLEKRVEELETAAQPEEAPMCLEDFGERK